MLTNSQTYANAPCSGTCTRVGGGGGLGGSLVCSDLLSEQIGRIRSKSEQSGYSQKNKERKSEENGESEQIGVNPLWRPTWYGYVNFSSLQTLVVSPPSSLRA